MRCLVWGLKINLYRNAPANGGPMPLTIDSYNGLVLGRALEGIGLIHNDDRWADRGLPIHPRHHQGKAHRLLVSLYANRYRTELSYGAIDIICRRVAEPLVFFRSRLTYRAASGLGLDPK